LIILFESVQAPNHNERGNGLALEHLDRLQQKCSALNGIEQRWWNRIEPNLQPYSATGEHEGWFAVISGIIENNDGTLRLRTVTGDGRSGTCFSLFLPFPA
jgi:hypothetical protein